VSVSGEFEPVTGSTEIDGRPVRGLVPSISTRPGPRPDDGERSALRDQLRVLRRRKWAIAQAVVVAALFAAFLSLRQQPLYRATANVFLAGHSVAADLDAADANLGASERARLAQTDADLARAPEIFNATVRRARAWSVTADDLRRHSKVSPRPTADVLDVSVTDASPARAQALATAYGRQFAAYRQRVQANAIETARRRLERRIDELRGAGASAATLAALQARSRDLLAEETLVGPEALLVRPAVSAEQTQPKTARNVAFGAALGLILGILFAFLRDSLDTRLRRTEEVGEIVGAPLLGRLREPSRRLRARNELVMLAEPYTADAEAFRILRANIEFARVDRHAVALMMTGAVDGEGRTTTAANLAVAAALAGRRVVLVDLDLRNPLIDRLFAIEGKPGLTDVALGHVSLAEALVPIPLHPTGQDALAAWEEEVVGGLEVLASGPVPLDSGEFVATRAVGQIVAALRARAELVIVDAPPLLPVGDARTLSRVVDGLILVLDVSVARRPVIQELRRVLDALPTRALGFVATGVDADGDDRYAGYDGRHAGRRRSRLVA
jgi:capsular exopolysaccharide synthesis family protein